MNSYEFVALLSEKVIRKKNKDLSDARNISPNHSTRINERKVRMHASAGRQPNSRNMYARSEIFVLPDNSSVRGANLISKIN